MCKNITHTSSGPTVRVANGATITSTKQVTLQLSPLLSQHAQKGHILPNLRSGSLISIGQLCDDNCVAIFRKHHVTILKQGQAIIHGTRNRSNGLWYIPMIPTSPDHLALRTTRPSPLHQANSVIRQAKTKSDLARFLHACAFSPNPSTLLRAIKQGHFDSWPNLSQHLITKHLPKSIATSKGHLRMQQKNLRSTKPKDLATLMSLPLSTSLDVAPAQEPSNKPTHNLFVTITSTNLLRKSYSDQTGKFPHVSSRGNQYIMIMYDYDTNLILSRPTKTRQAAELTQAWTELFLKLRDNGHAPTLHVLDNECSEDLRKAFQKYQVKFELVPPHVHRRNAAERAIQTWKNHFLAGIASLDPTFPIKEWDRLLLQCDITLNLLRSSRLHPNMSAWAATFGNFDFNRTPLAPPGTRVLVHETPHQRSSFAPHGVDGWYIGPSMNHYRCYNCFLPSSMSTRDALTVDWFPHSIPFPKVSTDDYLRQTADDMLHLLKTKQSNIPNLSYGDKITNAYIHIAQILKRATAPPPAPPQQLSEPPSAPAPGLSDPSPSPALLPRVNDRRSPPGQPPRVPPAPTRPHPPTPAPIPDPIPLPAPTLRPTASIRSKNTLKPPPKIHEKRLQPRRTGILQHAYRTRQSTRHRPTPTHLAQAATIQTKYHHHIEHLTNAITNSDNLYFQEGSGKQANLGKLLKGPDADIWKRGLCNEFGRLLSRGIGKNRPDSEKIKGTGTMFFIPRSKVPKGRKITYANFVCTIRPQKTETHRVRLTCGGDKLDYPGDPSSPAVSMLNAKLHINSTISRANEGAKYMCIDIKNFYLGTPMSYFQYMRIHKQYIPQEVLDEYPEIEFDHNGYAIVEIRRGMYGLKEAGVIAFDQLVRKLKPFGYEPMPLTPGLWRHTTKRTTFTLCVDDFGVQYFTKSDAEHLIDAIKSTYECSIDWEGTQYCGLTLDWHYDENYVDISMPGYVQKALTKFGHPAPKRAEYAPHDWTAPVYGKTPQKPNEISKAPLLSPEDKTRVQAITGTFLYYARGVDPTILVALNEISGQQSAPTTDTMKKCNKLMDYLHTHPNATIRYRASDMILYIESDAAYLVLPKARSRAAGIFYLSDKCDPKTRPPLNGSIEVLCKTLKNVVSSAAEAETGGIFMNGQYAVQIIAALNELGHPQPSQGIRISTDNSTARGVLTANLRQKLSKAFDMRYWWMRDRIKQNQFNLVWEPGSDNRADYFTKHFSPQHHKLMRQTYIHVSPTANCSTDIRPRGCVTPRTVNQPLFRSHLAHSLAQSQSRHTCPVPRHTCPVPRHTFPVPLHFQHSRRNHLT